MGLVLSEQVQLTLLYWWLPDRWNRFICLSDLLNMSLQTSITYSSIFLSSSYKSLLQTFSITNVSLWITHRHLLLCIFRLNSILANSLMVFSCLSWVVGHSSFQACFGFFLVSCRLEVRLDHSVVFYFVFVHLVSASHSLPAGTVLKIIFIHSAMLVLS
jgi:hypothetical protein